MIKKLYGIELDWQELKDLEPVFTRALLEAQRQIERLERIKENCTENAYGGLVRNDGRGRLFSTKQYNALKKWHRRADILTEILEEVRMFGE